MTIISRRPWQSQPQGLVDWSEGLFDVLLPSVPRACAKTGVPLTVSGTAAIDAGQPGRCFTVTASTTSYHQAASTIHALAGPLTFVAAYELTATPAGTARVSGTLDGSTSGYGFTPNNTNYRAVVSSGTPAVLVGDPITVGRVVVDVLTIGGASGTRTLRYFQDGLEKASTTASYTAGPRQLRIGAGHGETTAAAGRVYGVFVFKRALSAEEVQGELSTPLAAWKFAAQPKRIWLPVSAGGGINASVTLTGCSAASAAGATVALGSATAALSGASSAASAGTVTASAGSSASITLSGASSASAAGSLLATAGATAVLSGTSSASAAGAVAASAGASVTVVGSAASSAAGALTATAGGNAVATLTGASATSTAGSLTAGGSAGISLAGVGAAGAAGAVTATAGGAASVTLTGASASAAAGILAGFGGAQITLTGASASGAAGSASASAGSGSGIGASAAEIWSYTLSSGLTAEATLVAIHTMLSELHLIHGLTAGSPLSVTAASRAAGAVSQAVAEAAGTVTVTRQ